MVENLTTNSFIIIQIAVTIFTGLFIAGGTSWITVQLSIRQFRKEKWWEKKVDAYSSILNALQQAGLGSGIIAGRLTNKSGPGEKEQKMLVENIETLNWHFGHGTLFVSNAAASRLKILHSETSAGPSSSNDFYELKKSLENCRDEIIMLAKKDLKP